MKDYSFTVKDIDSKKIKKDLRGKTTIDASKAIVVNEDARFLVNGKVVGYMIKNFDKDTDTVERMIRGDLIYNRGHRAGGIPVTGSATFGWLPRVPMRADYCRLSKCTMERPVVKEVLYPLSTKVSEKYKEIDLAVYQKQLEIQKDLPSDFLMPDSIFTSGIVNRNARMRYHTDAGNFPGVWSSMLVYKRNIEGGNLHIPELGMVQGLEDGDLVMFDNQTYLHGVTKFTPTSKHYYRYTIVFYSLRNMLKCLPYKEEMDRFNKNKTKIALDYDKKTLKNLPRVKRD